METDSNNSGPSSRVIAWRRFLIETLLCLVLTGVIVVIAIHVSRDIFAAPAIAASTAAILRVVWHGAPPTTRRDDRKTRDGKEAGLL